MYCDIKNLSKERTESEKEFVKKIRFVRYSLIKWWTSNKKREKIFPWRSKKVSRYKALITEVLLQRTRADAVKKVYHSFFERFPTERHLAKATVEDIEKEINSLGLRWRAKKLRELAMEINRGGIPENIEELTSLPGVGNYAAGALLSLHRGKRAIIPDANMVRILGRIFGFAITPETRRNRNFLLLCDAITPRKYFREFNYAVLDFGREICTPHNPKSNICPLNSICERALKTRSETL